MSISRNTRRTNAPSAKTRVALTALLTILISFAGGFERTRITFAQDSWITDELRSEIDEFVNAHIEIGAATGVAIGIVDRGNVVFSKGYGYANLDEQLRVATDTPFQIASMSKPFASAAIALLVREGKLSWSDPIGSHLEGLPDDWQPVTIQQLLSHTSGIADYTNVDNIRELYQQDTPRDEMLQYLYGLPLEFEPGSAHAYSNSGYTLIGIVVEQVSGESYGEFLESRIFTPLEMRTARLEPLRNDDSSRAIGYEATNEGFQTATYNSPSWSFAAGGIVASIDDMCKFDAAIDGETLLTKEELAHVWTPQQIDGTPTGFGLGWQLRPGPGGTHFAYHQGGKPGFSSMLARLIEQRVSIVVLVNTTDGGASQILDGVGQRVLARRPR